MEFPKYIIIIDDMNAKAGQAIPAWVNSRIV